MTTVRRPVAMPLIEPSRRMYEDGSSTSDSRPWESKRVPSYRASSNRDCRPRIGYPNGVSSRQIQLSIHSEVAPTFVTLIRQVPDGATGVPGLRVVVGASQNEITLRAPNAGTAGYDTLSKGRAGGGGHLMSCPPAWIEPSRVPSGAQTSTTICVGPAL